MALPKMSGKKLTDAAVELAHLRGYRAAHFHSASVRYGKTVTPYSYDSKGWPDLILVGPKVVAIEVKGTGDSLRVEQVEWLQAFEDAGVETLILTVRAYTEGALEALL